MLSKEILDELDKIAGELAQEALKPDIDFEKLFASYFKRVKNIASRYLDELDDINKQTEFTYEMMAKTLLATPDTSPVLPVLVLLKTGQLANGTVRRDEIPLQNQKKIIIIEAPGEMKLGQSASIVIKEKSPKKDN